MRRARSTMATRWLIVAPVNSRSWPDWKSHIVEQCRFGESIFGDLIGVVNTLPPAEKVQQLVRVGSQSSVGQTAKGFVIEVLVDPFNLTAGRLLDNAVRAADMIVRRLGNYTECHQRAASRRHWN